MNNEMVFGSEEYWKALLTISRADSIPAYKKAEIQPTDVHGVDADGFACYTVHFDF